MAVDEHNPFTLLSIPTYDITNWSNAVASAMMLLNSSLGILFNVLIIYNFICDNHQKNSFNLVCVVRAVNNIYVLSVTYLGVFLPITVLGYTFYTPILESLLISIALNCNIYNEFQSIFMAANRLFAIFFPLKYDLVFNIKLTLLFHICYYIERTHNVTTRIIDRYEQRNYLLYNVEYLAYGGLVESADLMFIWAIGLTFIPFAINAVTFIRFYYIRKRATRDSEKWKQARKNMIKFVQTVFQDSMYPISIVFNMKLNTLIHHRIWYFFCQTFVWQLLHTLDGFIMIMFNDRLTLLKKSIIARISPAQSQQRGAKVTSPPVVIVAEPVT